jgi:hypothetical protein
MRIRRISGAITVADNAPVHKPESLRLACESGLIMRCPIGSFSCEIRGNASRPRVTTQLARSSAYGRKRAFRRLPNPCRLAAFTHLAGGIDGKCKACMKGKRDGVSVYPKLRSH